jgi:5-methylcytosine-specific restriction endonuclease McrA
MTNQSLILGYSKSGLPITASHIQPHELKIANLQPKTLYLRQEGKCFYCRILIPQDEISFDHFWPRFAGNHKRRNIVLSCKKCNTKKGCQPPRPHEIQRFIRLYKGQKVWD